jgi:hypothetical protein
VDATQSVFVLHATHTPREAMHVGAFAGHVPPSAHEGKHWWLEGSHTSPTLQSPVTKHWTHSLSVRSHRGEDGVHCVSSMHATH